MSRIVLRLISACLACAAVSHAGILFPTQPGVAVVAGQYLVRLKPGVAASLISSYLPSASIQPLRALNLHLITIPQDQLGIQSVTVLALNSLASDELVQYIEPNHIRHITQLTSPNDTSYNSSTQWDLFTVRALQAWGVLSNSYLTAASANPGRITAATIDTGVDCTHPDFANAGGTSADSALGGQILFAGSVAVIQTTVSPPACAWQDDYGHGTHVAGTLAAATNNAVGVASLGYPLQMIVYKGLGSDGSGTDDVLANAIMEAVDSGVRVISASWGESGYSQALQDAINYAWQRNTLFVAAAGNSGNGSLFFPAGATFAVGVAATDSSNNRAGYSNNGDYVRIAAPGSGIYSTMPTYANPMGPISYGTFSGTSMATPHVAALAGLLWTQTPNASAAAVLQRIQQSAYCGIPASSDCTSAMGGWSGDFGYGIINADNAVSGTLQTGTVGGLTGQVTDQAGNLVAAQLSLNPASSPAITADSNGRYRFVNLPVGTYQVTVSASGYTTLTLSATIAPGADTILPFVFGDSYGCFTGTVQQAGLPVGSAIVQALSSGLISGTAVADSTGSYTLWVTPGTYDVTASALSANPATVTGQSVTAGSTCSTTVNLSITSPENAAPVTVMTNPTGLNVMVDGVTYAGPHFFVWTQGISHMLDTTATQGSGSTQYAFTGWNNGGNQSQSVTGNGPAYYTANFKTQYLLTTAASPSAGGSISPATGFFDANSSVPVTATPASGYQFTGFTGDLSGTTNPQNVSMTMARSVVANFTATGTITVTTLPAGLTIIVDNTTYTAPQSFTWTQGSMHTLTTNGTQGSGTTQHVFTGWNNTTNISQSVTVNGAATYTASFKTQYQLTTSVSPSGGGSITPASGFFDANSSVPVTATAATGYQFTGFSGDLTGTMSPQNVTMSAARSVTASFGATVAVMVTTSPGGLSIVVDNTTYTAPQSFTWVQGSMHTLTTTATQVSGSTQYVFTGWNNTTNISQSVTVNGAATYTAGFKTRYQLTTSVSPSGSGSITPATGFFDANSSVPVTATAATGYQFTGFSGDLSGTTNPQSVTMSAARSVVANFTATGTITVTTLPAGLTIIVDNTTYTAPQSFTWIQNSTHTLGTMATQGTGSTQDVFTGWNNTANLSQTVTVNGAATYTASFKTQYQLTTSASPSAGGSITPSSGFYDSGASVAVTATAASGYQFTGFSGYLSGTTNPQNVTMSAPRSVTANFAATASIMVTTSPGGLSIVVDNTTYTAPQSFTWTQGSLHTLTTMATQGSGSTQHVFTGWNNTTNLSQNVTVNGAAIYTASFKTQYQLTTSVSPAAGGSIAPSTGFYDSGTTVPVTATAASGYQFTNFSGSLSGTTNPQNVTMSAARAVTANFAALAAVMVTTSPGGLSIVVDNTTYTAPQSFTWVQGSTHTLATTATQGSSSTQYVFTGWNNTANLSQTVTVNGAATYTASFKTQYQLTTSASPSAGGSITPSSGFYDSGASVAVTATAASGYQFTGFSGDLSGTTNPQNVTMSAARSVVANFTATGTVTVTTLPAGLTFVVDSKTYTAPQSFTWLQGSTHTLGTTATQGSGSTQYVFTGWNNTANISQTVTMNGAATYTAGFTTQYQLTTAASPSAAGSISPVSGFYNSGATVAVTGTAANGYQFTGFSGDLSGAANPQNLPMTAARSVTANFACLYVLGTPSSNVGAGASTGSVSLNTGAACSWSATGNDSWISVSSGVTGAGSGAVGYMVAANPKAASRTGTITIGGQTFTIVQAGKTNAIAHVRDFRAIGRSDAAIYDPVLGQEYTALSNGDGTFKYVPNLFSPGFDTLRTGDFNGDGKADMVLYDSQTSLAYIGFSKGDGTFAFQSLFWSPGYDIVEAGDLNGDGKTDFALYNSSTGTLYTGISKGDGTFTYKYTLVSKNFTFARLADFTGDGKADLLLYNAANGASYLGVGDGAGGFTFHPLFVSPGYNLADIGDLNGDGETDVIFYNSVTGTAASGISNGVGGFTFTPLVFSAGFTSVRLADYTGDGKADATVYDKSDAVAYFGAGNGNGTFAFQSLFWSTGYDVVEPQDVTGDGMFDMLLYNSTTGTSYTGIGNGSGAFSYTYALWGPGKKLAR